jgi:hypothetical protein
LISIKAVADDGISEMRRMDAYLVHAPCFNYELHERDPAML